MDMSYDSSILLPIIDPKLETLALGNMNINVYNSIVSNAKQTKKNLEVIQMFKGRIYD